MRVYTCVCMCAVSVCLGVCGHRSVFIGLRMSAVCDFVHVCY